MVGTQFVQITKDQVIANPLHFIANPKIALEPDKGNYIGAEIVFSSDEVITIKIKDNIYAGKEGPVALLHKAGSLITILLDGEQGLWRVIDTGFLVICIYGTSPD
jgi:hypothetical protein